MKFFIGLSFILLFFSHMLIACSYSTLISDENSLQKIMENIFKENNQKFHFSALPVTVQCGQYNKGQPETLFPGTIGLDDAVPIDSDTLFQIGSLTKSFVSIILLQLADDPTFHFSLNDKVEKWFGEDYPQWKSVTIRQLLNMTSRIPDYINHLAEEYVNHPYQNISTKKILDSVKQLPLNPITDTLYEYSNTNYVLAGLLVTRLTGHSLRDEITQRIINKLKLRHTFYVENLPEEIITDNKLAHGYSYREGDSLLPMGIDISRWSLSFGNASGAMLSTTSDINTYIRAIFTPGMLLNQKELNQLTSLVSEKTGKPILDVSPADPDGYGLGIYKSIFKKDGGKYYNYTGGSLGFYFTWIYDPIQNASLVISMNSVYQNKKNEGNLEIVGEKLLNVFYKYCNVK